MNEPFKTLTLLEINYYLFIKYLIFQVMNEKIKRLNEEMIFGNCFQILKLYIKEESVKQIIHNIQTKQNLAYV